MMSQQFSESDYQQALEWLYVQMPNYQTDGKKAYKPGLDNIKKLCAFYGNPQDKIKTIHIGGTNGKGSVSNMLASVLQEAGYKVGVYNSPHLIDFRERIKINGKICDKTFVYNFINQLKSLPKDILPSFFEFTTIMAFDYFYKQNTDLAIIEVGLGGRLDSTNIISPLVSAITNIQLDHQDILGDTLEEIAIEKAGIIKKNTPFISGEDKPEIKKILLDIATEKQAPFIDATLLKTNLKSDLKGEYQAKNIPVVLSLVEELRKLNYAIADKNIKDGLLNVEKNTHFIGRWYRFSKDPLIICDTAHNNAGLTAVLEQLNNITKQKHMVLGFVKEKKIEEVLKALPKNAKYYFVKPNITRGRDPKEYEDLLKNAEIDYKIFSDVNSGYLDAKRNLKAEEMIFIGGSNFVVGEFLEKNLQK